MPNYLTIDRTYADNDILYEADFDNIATSIETFCNTTKLNEDNISSGIIERLAFPGLIALFSIEDSPTGWLACDGSVVSQATYADLYGVVGSTYNTGGEGGGNFRLPNYARRVPVGRGGSGTAVLGNALGNTGGEETHTLASDKSTIPSHAHPDTVGHAHVMTGRGGAGSVDSTLFRTSTGISTQTPVLQSTSAETSTITYNNTGGGDAHDNVQPSLVMQMMIKI